MYNIYKTFLLDSSTFAPNLSHTNFSMWVRGFLRTSGQSQWLYIMTSRDSPFQTIYTCWKLQYKSMPKQKSTPMSQKERERKMAKREQAEVESWTVASAKVGIAGASVAEAVAMAMRGRDPFLAVRTCFQYLFCKHVNIHLWRKGRNNEVPVFI